MKPLTREFLLRRGHCCKNGCKNCPYGYDKTRDKRRRTKDNGNM